MTNENSRVDYFLNTNGSGITLELGTALIAKFGGVMKQLPKNYIILTICNQNK